MTAQAPDMTVTVRFFHTASENFETGVFTLKTHQVFSVHAKLEEFENATLSSHFGFVFEEISVRALSHMVIVTSSFSKSSVQFQNVF